MLLGGAVIGSAGDLSATYYNPGMLAISKESGLLVGANVYQYTQLDVEGTAIGQTRSSKVRPASGLVAGRVPVDTTVLGGVAYSILTRSYFNADIEYRRVGIQELPGGAGQAQSSRERLLLSDLSDTWAGVTFFRLISPKVSVGISTYASVYSRVSRNSRTASVLLPGNSLALSSEISNIDYFNAGLIWKAGMGFDLDDLTLGFTITSPRLNVLGSGTAYYSSSYNGPSDLADTAQSTFLLATNQEDLPSHYSIPWSFAFGAAYRVGKTRIHFSGEYFGPVELYNLLETEPFTGQSDGQTHALPFTMEMTSLFNFGLGVEVAPSEAVSLFGSLRTDLSGLPDGTTSNTAITNWDLYHLTGGTVLTFESMKVTLGVSCAWGSTPLNEVPMFDDSAATVADVTLGGDAKVRMLALTGILAFTFAL